MTSGGVSLSHPYLQAFVVCYGRHCLNTPTTIPLDLYVQPVARVVLQERIFPRHDLHSNHSALEHTNARDLHCDQVFATLCSGRWSLVIVM